MREWEPRDVKEELLIIGNPLAMWKPNLDVGGQVSWCSLWLLSLIFDKLWSLAMNYDFICIVCYHNDHVDVCIGLNNVKSVYKLCRYVNRENF